MKHLKLKMLTMQEWMKTGTLRIHKVSTHDNPADFMTKTMTREKRTKFGRALNFEWIILRRPEPLTCTVTSITPITVLMQTDK